MKNPKIVLVAEWDGWCGACAAERPLVLTRTGRLRLRTWLTGAVDHSRPLVLTCRLCGTGVDVPPEQDDPPLVELWQDAAPSAAEPVLPEPVPATPVLVAASAADLTAARHTVAQALGALLAQRSAVAAAPAVAPVPLVGAAVPLQRTPSSGGLAELQLLADGIDLLSSGRP